MLTSKPKELSWEQAAAIPEAWLTGASCMLPVVSYFTQVYVCILYSFPSLDPYSGNEERRKSTNSRWCFWRGYRCHSAGERVWCERGLHDRWVGRQVSHKKKVLKLRHFVSPLSSQEKLDFLTQKIGADHGIN